jgi:hypothetical protein
MPNSLGPTGLTVQSRAELITYFTDQFKNIYGVDINLNADSPDGQLMNIIVQQILDVQDLLVQIYNQFDPDLAIGMVLDQRVAINGIQRQAGTHTVTNVTLVITQAVTLYGADQNTQPIYTVEDNIGTKWELLETQLISGAGTYAYAFQAQQAGAISSTPNTITVPVTVVLGVQAINNPTTYTTLGVNEESDAALKIRRQLSTAISSQGYLAGLIAALENITGMDSVFVYENVTGSTDGDGIPSHSIWVIVSGTALPASIANAIYAKRNAGCGMKGTEVITIIQPDGSNFNIKWDNVTPEDLFIKFTATSLDGINDPNIALIRETLVTAFVPGVAAKVNINELSTLVQDIDPNTLVTSAGFCLTDSGVYTNTLSPSTKDKQFAVSEDNIIILPIIVTPKAPTVAHGEDIAFSAVGGGTGMIYTWTIHTNNSSGTINSATGEYTAGATFPVVDVVRATDDLGNFTAVNVSVT